MPTLRKQAPMVAYVAEHVLPGEVHERAELHILPILRMHPWRAQGAIDGLPADARSIAAGLTHAPLFHPLAEVAGALRDHLRSKTSLP